MEVMAGTFYGCRQSKEPLRKLLDAVLSKYALSLPRQKLRILVGLLTGHAISIVTCI